MLKLRKWQQKALERSKESNGIFLEALGGRGKTIAALVIAKEQGAKKIIITNNRLNILKGWEDAIKIVGFDADVEFIIKTDKTLANLVKAGHKLKADVLIIDEWQNMSSDKQVSLYRKINRKYTIGLSATPIRKKGQNFYPLEKTLWKKANPNNKFDWQKRHGQMVYDPFTYSKEKWKDFVDYESYISNLPNFMTWEEIEKIENAENNNGFKVRFYKNTIDVANPELLQQFRKYNLVKVGDQSAMAKQSFGRNTFERYLNQTGVDIDFPKLKAKNADTPLLVLVDKLIKRTPSDMLIISKSKQIVNIIQERNPSIGIWTGDKKERTDSNVVVATSQVLGVGVDGLQHKYHTAVILDPIPNDSGEYDDYRQLLWRITGSRQQHDVNIIEIYFKGENNE